MYDFMYPVDDVESGVIAEVAVPELYKRRKLEEQRLAQIEQITKLYTQPLSEQLSALGRPKDLSYEDGFHPAEEVSDQAGMQPYALNRQNPIEQSASMAQQPVQQAPAQYVQPSVSNTGTAPVAQSVPVQSNGGKSLSQGVQQWRPLVTEIASKYGIDPDKALAIMQIESQGKTSVKNGKGAPYGGLFQISTGIKGWDDPRVNTEHAMKQMASRTNMFKKAYGREPTAGELYLLQQQGEGGAMALLNPKNANRPVEQVLAEVGEWKRRYGGDPNKVLQHVVLTNGGKAGMTAAQFASQWVSKADGIYSGNGSKQQVASAKPERKVLKETKSSNTVSAKHTALGSARGLTKRQARDEVLDSEIKNELAAIEQLNIQLKESTDSVEKQKIMRQLQSRTANIKAIAREKTA